MRGVGQFILGIVTLLSIPLWLLNTFGGIVAAVWLGFLGEWGSIGYGLLVLFSGTLAIGIALIPGLIFAVPAAALLDQGRMILGGTIGSLGALWTIAVITTWCCSVLYLFGNRSDSASIIPHMIWGYAVASGPISYMAQKELQSGNWGSTFATIVAELAMITTIIAVLITSIRVIDALMIIGSFMIVGFVLQAILSIAESRAAGQVSPDTW